MSPLRFWDTSVDQYFRRPVTTSGVRVSVDPESAPDPELCRSPEDVRLLAREARAAVRDASV